MGLALPTGREKVSRALGLGEDEGGERKTEIVTSRLGPGPLTPRASSATELSHHPVAAASSFHLF